ncbi:hypothetical protein HDU85_002100 [Gaertneriomyces sp. JEL0708]|nr:hypothetical protein HDU85_002100 [Gaertneriomyces sp. JEL0708]
MTSGEPPRAAGTRSSTAPDVLRSRNRKRDDAIRKKVEHELSRKTHRSSRHTTSRRIKSGTVSSLRPAPAIIILETARIVQAAQLMAAKRADAVLAVNEEGALVGILTDKDIAYRVVAEGLDVRNTVVSQVMTTNPISVYDRGNRNEALNIMVSRRFRHLPVISDGPGGEDDVEEDVASDVGTGTSVVGLLDITKCVFERIDDLERKVTEDHTIISAMETLERRGEVGADHVGRMREQHGCPDVGTVLAQMNVDHVDGVVPEIGIKATVRDAARTMKANHQTAVLVSAGETDDRIGGIFTTKDIVLRVIAASLDPATTSVVRVMTPHPDSVSTDTSILDALKKLHAGHYLHLPVVEAGAPAGLVDVMTLTISMLTYLMSKDGGPETSGGESGPMWNRFWNSTFASSNVDGESDRHSQASDSITGSVVSHNLHNAPSDRGSVVSYGQRPQSMYDTGSSGVSPNKVLPIDSASMVGSSLYQRPNVDMSQFAFKLRDRRTGKVYRFTSLINSLAELEAAVHKKCGITTAHAEVDSDAMKLNYIDDEGDAITLSSDKDLEEAVMMARIGGLNRVVLVIGTGASPLGHDGPRPVQDDDGSSVASSGISRKRLQDETGSVYSGVGTPGGQNHHHRAMVVHPTAGGAGGELVGAVAQPIRREENAVMQFLRDAPLPVNVAISSAIVMAMGVIFVKLTK